MIHDQLIGAAAAGHNRYFSRPLGIVAGGESSTRPGVVYPATMQPVDDGGRINHVATRNIRFPDATTSDLPIDAVVTIAGDDWQIVGHEDATSAGVVVTVQRTLRGETGRSGYRR